MVHCDGETYKWKVDRFIKTPCPDVSTQILCNSKRNIANPKTSITMKPYTKRLQDKNKMECRIHAHASLYLLRYDYLFTCYILKPINTS